MPIGVITNCMAVFLGGLLGGTVLRKITPWYLKQNLPFMFGLCSIGIAVNSLVKAHNMSAVCSRWGRGCAWQKSSMPPLWI